MRKVQEESVDSHSQIQRVFEEQEAVSENFRVSNFYTNQRLNIAELKNRLEQFKKNHNQTLPPHEIAEQTIKDNKSESMNSYQNKFQGAFPGEAGIQKQKVNLQPANRQRLTLYEQPRNHFNDYTRLTENGNVNKERIEEVKQANYRIVREVRRYDDKIRTASGKRQHMTLVPKSMHSQYQRGQSHMEKSKGENLDQSKCSNSSNKQSNLSANWALEGKLVISNKSQLVEFQKYVTCLWGHYQLLTKILVGLREGAKHDKNTIVKYVEDICSDRFEFVRALLVAISRQGAQRNECLFVKRLIKAVILSRLLQNLAVVYVGLGICFQREPEAHLVNFVGYCCSNVTFLIRWAYLLHSMNGELKLSAAVSHVMSVIGEFEEGSYKTTISKISDVVLRMEHNNQIIGIVQGRLCNSMDKQFQKIIVTFLKNVDLASKPLYQYSHYIYEFVAYHLAQKNVIGQFSFLEMAPSPYLNPLSKQKTLVIEPWQVLLASKGPTIYIRSYCETLLRQVGKYWNIVYWTDLMPDTIDHMIDKLPEGKVLYRYHCRYENDRYLKLLWRLGCDNDNTIIIDRDESNFKYDREMGIALPWCGKKKDNKLLEFLGYLHNFLTQDLSLRKVFGAVKQAMHGKRQRKVNSVSEPKEDESMFPRAVIKTKKVRRLQNYQY